MVGAEPQQCDLHQRRHRGQHAGADAGSRRGAPGRATGCSSRRSSIPRCAAAAASRRARSRKLPVDAGWRRRSRRARGLRSRKRAGRWFRSCSPITKPASSSRSRRPPRSCTRPAASCMSMPCRRPGRMPLDIDALGADLLTPLGAQDRRPAGRRRADPARADIAFRRAADPRRRAGARLRAPAPRTWRRSPASARPRRPRWPDSPARPRAWRRCGTGWKRPSGGRAGRGHFRRRRAAAAEHDAVRGARHQGRDRADRLRSRGDRGVVGLRLLVRQGAALACACRHGRSNQHSRGRRSASAWAGKRPKPTSTAANAWKKLVSTLA